MRLQCILKSKVPYGSIKKNIKYGSRVQEKFGAKEFCNSVCMHILSTIDSVLGQLDELSERLKLDVRIRSVEVLQILNFIFSLQTVSQEDSDPHARNPMLYDPLQDGVVKTSKKMQYVAALIGEYASKALI